MQPAAVRLDFRTREQAAYDYLRRAIVLGTWGPHEPIVGSRVAAELGVSRITIANALKRLAGEGFVRLVPHKEATVNSLSAAEIEETYTLRAVLEAEVAFLLAQRAVATDIASLRRLNSRLGHVRSTGDVAAIRAADFDLHRRMRETIGMPRLTELVANLADNCEYYRARLLDTSGIAVPTASGHEELLEAIAAHAAEQARELGREHVLRGMRSILSVLERDAS